MCSVCHSSSFLLSLFRSAVSDQLFSLQWLWPERRRRQRGNASEELPPCMTMFDWFWVTLWFRQWAESCAGLFTDGSFMCLWEQVKVATGRSELATCAVCMATDFGLHANVVDDNYATRTKRLHSFSLLSKAWSKQSSHRAVSSSGMVCLNSNNVWSHGGAAFRVPPKAANPLQRLACLQVLVATDLGSSW